MNYDEQRIEVSIILWQQLLFNIANINNLYQIDLKNIMFFNIVMVKCIFGIFIFINACFFHTVFPLWDIIVKL